MTTADLIKNSVSIPAKEIADDLNLSKELVYKWGQGSQRNPIDRVEYLMSVCENKDIINYLCQKSDGYFIELPKVEETSSEICANACKEFGELLTAMSTALSDGVVDQVEYNRINKEWSDLQNVMHGFLREQKKLISKGLI